MSLNYGQFTTNIRDVHDTFYFKKLRRENQNTHFITLTFSTDGAAIFKATKEKSVWPLQFIVNEINLENRFKRENVFCSAVSYGKTPDMRIFFKPFVNEINAINSSGGLSFKSNSGEMITVMIQPMIFTGDILAKQDVLNKASFHGYFGCSYCLHPGKLVNGHVRYTDQLGIPDRSNESTRDDMIQAETSGNKVNGFNGVSALMAIQNIDIVWQIGIDKMHNIDMGITKKMFNLFLDETNSKER